MGIQPDTAPGRYGGSIYNHAPRNVYWEMTQACDLACSHCRANAQPNRDADELTTAQARALFDEVKRMGSMLILTGGDPMKRDDLFELIEYGRSIHLPISITPSTTPGLTRDAILRFGELGVSALGISIDGPTPEVHDGFRNVSGTFARALDALGWARDAGLPVQINTTVCRETLPHVPRLHDLLVERFTPPVRRWSLFLLVPVGRAAQLGAPDPTQVDELFAWVYERAASAPFHIGTVEAPHYRRYYLQRKLQEGVSARDLARNSARLGLGVRDGNGVIFVSHHGDVFPAGFLPSPKIGNVKHDALGSLYSDSPRLRVLRDPENYTGRCGRCEFQWACGGSRARAFASSGDPLADDPLCGYVPGADARPDRPVAPH